MKIWNEDTLLNGLAVVGTVIVVVGIAILISILMVKITMCGV